MVGKFDSKENPKSNLDLDLGFVNREFFYIEISKSTTI